MMKINPIDAWPEEYNEEGFRTSPDIKSIKVNDIWYDGNGIRNETRSPKQDIPIFNN